MIYVVFHLTDYLLTNSQTFIIMENIDKTTNGLLIQGANNTSPTATPEKSKLSRKRNASSAPAQASRMKNLIWNYAIRIKTEKSDTASCKIPNCKKSFIICKGSAYPVKYHLEKDHPKLYAQFLKDVKQQQEEQQQVSEEILQAEVELQTEMKRPKTTIAQYFPSKYPLGDKRQLKFDKTVIEYLVETSLPFAHVESEGFKNFVANLDPRVNIKCGKTFSSLKLPKLYKAMKVEMNTKTKKDFAIDIGVSFTTDCWTSRANDPFLSLTLHYISPEWELVRFLVACIPFEGRHTAQRLAGALDETIQTIFGLSMDPVKSPKVVVHDAAANMKATIPRSTLGLKSFICLDHRLQTMLKKIFKSIPGLDDLMKQATKLATKCHQSALTCEKIREEAKSINDTYVKVVAPVATRWNSNFLMISSIMKIKKTLMSLAENNADLDVPLFDADEFWCLEQMEQVFGRFDAASQQLSADKTCTLPNILVTLCNLTTQTETQKKKVGLLPVDSTSKVPSEKSKKAIISLLTSVQHQLETEFPDYGGHDDLISLGHVLHPFFRGALLKRCQRFDEAIKSIVESHPSTADYKAKKQDQENAKSQDLFDDVCIDDLNDAELLCMQLEKEEQEEYGAEVDDIPPIQEEIDRYLRLPKPEEKGKVDILKWWQDHEKILPILSHFAKGILAIPASSASSERTFSAAGNIVTAQRYNLDPKTTQILTWCQQNWKVLNKVSWNVQDEYEEKTEDDQVTSQPFDPTQASGDDYQLTAVARSKSILSVSRSTSNSGSVKSFAKPANPECEL